MLTATWVFFEFNYPEQFILNDVSPIVQCRIFHFIVRPHSQLWHLCQGRLNPVESSRPLGLTLPSTLSAGFGCGPLTLARRRRRIGSSLTSSCCSVSTSPAAPADEHGCPPFRFHHNFPDATSGPPPQLTRFSARASPATGRPPARRAGGCAVARQGRHAGSRACARAIRLSASACASRQPVSRCAE